MKRPIKTIAVSPSTYNKLKVLKEIHGKSFDKLISYLIDFYSTNRQPQQQKRKFLFW